MTIAGILKAAPVLQRVTRWADEGDSQHGNCLVITTCTDAEIQSTLLLGQRLGAGLLLEGLDIRLNSHYSLPSELSYEQLVEEREWRDELVEARDVLYRLPPLPGFTISRGSDESFKIHDPGTNVDEVNGCADDSVASYSLSHIARVTPDLVNLRMDWLCDAANTSSQALQLSVGSSVRTIF